MTATRTPYTDTTVHLAKASALATVLSGDFDITADIVRRMTTKQRREFGNDLDVLRSITDPDR
ncbi:hypothetical protein ABZ404_39180 [Streptomyces sp. NPDC005878]|uniref:hypothetical protein n=1 Tax=Streptomyces sp. NPDC005878 TaxID=3157077 RepID=UPI00341142F2